MGRVKAASGALFCGVALWLAMASPAACDTPLRTPDYLRDATRLAGLIGKAHAVRVRCSGRQDQYWRDFMAGLLELEAPAQGGLRRDLVDAFNRNYSREFGDRRFCDEEAKTAEAEYAAQGRAISERLAQFYFPKPGRGTR